MATLKISDELKNVIKQVVLDTYYPIGKTYITMGSEDPNKTIGGTWVKISGGYLYATGSNALGKTNFNGWGTQSTTLSITQIPSHTHRIGFKTSWGSTVYNSATQDGYAGPRNSGDALNYGSGPNGPYVQPQYGILFNEETGGNQGHTHNVATIDIWLWKRTA